MLSTLHYQVEISVIILIVAVIIVIWPVLSRKNKNQNVLEELDEKLKMLFLHHDSLNDNLTSKLERFLNSVKNDSLLFIDKNCEYEYLLDTAFLYRIASVDRICTVRHSDSKIAELREMIDKEGLKEPLEVVFDDNGLIKLQNGHHRLLACLDYSMMPVKIKKVNKAVNGHHLNDMDILFGHRRK